MYLDKFRKIFPYGKVFLISTQRTILANSFGKGLVLLVECSEQGFILCSYTLIGIAYHFGSYERFSVRNALVVFDDLSLDVIQSQIDVSRFFTLAFCSIAFHIL